MKRERERKHATVNHNFLKRKFASVLEKFRMYNAHSYYIMFLNMIVKKKRRGWESVRTKKKMKKGNSRSQLIKYLFILYKTKEKTKKKFFFVIS